MTQWFRMCAARSAWLYRTNWLLGGWEYLLTNQPGTGTGTNTVSDTNGINPSINYQIRGRVP